MKKTLIISLVVVVVLGGIVCGLVYMVQNTGNKLLQKADLALQSGNFDKALQYAQKYISDNPRDWRGYYSKARVQCGARQFEEARKTLEQALKEDRNQPSIHILIAQSYSLDARKTLETFMQEGSKALSPKRLQELQESIDKYNTAQKVLAAAPSATVEVARELGMMQIEHATARQWLARQMEEDAFRAKAQRDEKTSKKRIEQSNEARDTAKRLLTEATANLLKVIALDPKQRQSATRLVELCLERQDDKMLALARQAIQKMENPPPVAAMLLEMYAMQSSAAPDGPVDRKRIEKSIQVLDDILSKSPDVGKLKDAEKSEYNQVKYAKAELTQRLGDLDATRNLCEEIIKSEPRNPRARLTLAKLLVQKNEIAEAEMQLLTLSREFPNWADAQYSYATVALQIGKKNAAMEALKSIGKLPPNPQNKLLQAELALVLSDLRLSQRLVEEVLFTQPGNSWARLLQGNIMQAAGQLDQAERVFTQLAKERKNWPQVQLALAQVCSQTGHIEAAIQAANEAVKLDPNNVQARKLLAGMLLKESKFDQAFAEAQTSIKARPDDPAAIKLYVEAAERNNHTDLALVKLDQCLKDYKNNPEVMMAAAEGYANLNKRDKAVEAANLARQGAVPTALARLAVVRALMLLDRMPEAEKTLSEELKKEPDRADLRFQMGQICAATGRMLPAVDQLRQALKLDPNNIGYRVSLARALLDSGDLGEANEVLSQVDESNPTAKVLRLQIQLMSGQQRVNMEQMLTSAQGSDRANIALTLPYLTNEQLRQCVEYCNAELLKTPDDTDLHLLLGRALLALGQQDQGIKQWEFVLAKAPDRLSAYLELASILSRDASLDQVLANGPHSGARLDMINLAIGRMVAAMGDYEKAAAILDKIAQRPDVPDHVRGRAILLLGQVLAMGGKTDQALEEFQKLFSSQTWRKDAMFNKAQVLGATKKMDEFKSILAELRKIAQADKNTSLLRNIAELYANRECYDLALQACEEVTAISPDDARNFRLQAAVLNLAKKYDEAIRCFDKAIAMQPQNPSLYLAQMQIYDRQEKSLEALGVLRKLEKNGQSASVVAMFQRGQLFASWGLLDQAAECYGKLSNLGFSGNPQVKLALGQAYAMLGKRQEATKYLESIPSFAEEYVAARQMQAQLARDAQTALQIVRQLQDTQPLNEKILLQHMQILIATGRMEEAIKTFDAFVAQPRLKRLPEDASFVALQLMLESKQEDAALELAQRAVQGHLSRRWQIYQAILMLPKDPAAAVKTLPAMEKADMVAALIQLYASSKSGDKTASDKWAARVDELLRKDPSNFDGATFQLLLDIALKNGRAKEDLSRVRNVFGFGRSAAEELVASEAKNPKAAAEAMDLLISGVAQGVQLPSLSRLYAMKVLKNRPTCQWAAVMGVFNNSRSQAFQEFLSVLEPKDCPIALVIEAQLLAGQAKFEEAAGAMARACQSDKTSELLLRHSVYLEMTGKIDQAAALQRKVWTETQDVRAANNLAYLMLASDPTNKVNVAEAMELIRKAIEKQPDDPSFRDTLGYIYYLQGRHEQACMELRKAIKGQPESAEMHYHLGIAEAACMRVELARWHLAAALSIGKTLNAQQAQMTPQMKQTLELSQKALNLLGPEK